MIQEMEYINFREQFETIIQSGDKEKLCAFLDDQNISDVAELIYDYPDQEALIISSLSIHRAASVFKILELTKARLWQT